MDKIFIQGLETTTIIGIHDWEQSIHQKVIFDIEMTWDTTLAIQTDNEQYCLNYAKVSEAIIDFCQKNTFLLIERLADELAKMLQTQFAIPWLKLTVHKPHAIPNAKTVGITIERHMK